MHLKPPVETGRSAGLRYLSIVIFLLLLAPGLLRAAEDRIPRPEFKSDYQTPRTTTPLPATAWLEYMDVLVLMLTLFAASYLALQKRSHNALLMTCVFSVLYFGFWRKGCVCSVGSLQNVTLALFDSGYAIPFSVVLFFLLPLIFTLFFGRTFCAAVCPFGALQELVTLKPVQLPSWLNRGLGIIPVVYLALALLFAATGAEFIICRFDPFVGFFRRGAQIEMLSYGLIILALGVFIARPYCRFLCPYGVILGWFSRLARRQVTITPDYCINCRLCENSCPTGAIVKPLPADAGEPAQRGPRRIASLLVLLPLLAFICGLTLSSLAPLFSQAHPDVKTALQVKLENSNAATLTTLESDTFRASGRPLADLFTSAETIQHQFVLGGWIIGCLLGLVLFFRLLDLSVLSSRQDYHPDPEECVSCTRCFSACPREALRLRTVKGDID